MLDPQKLEQFAKQITDAMPEGIKSMANETETKSNK